MERLCRKQWTSVNQQITQKREYYYEHNRNEARDTGKLLRYPVGIVFSFDDGLVSIELMRNIANGTDLPSQLTYTIRTFYSEISNTVEGFPFIERTTDAKKFPGTCYKKLIISFHWSLSFDSLKNGIHHKTADLIW